MGEIFVACLKPEHLNDFMKVHSDPNSDLLNKHLKCYVGCMLEKIGFYNKSTGWNVDYIVEQFGLHGHEEEVRAGLNECAEKYSDLPGECESEFQINECLNRLHRSLTGNQ